MSCFGSDVNTACAIVGHSVVSRIARLIDVVAENDNVRIVRNALIMK